MSSERRALSDGTFVFAECENKNEFYFYRSDEAELGDVGRLPMDFYQAYIARKMMDGEITTAVMSNLYYEKSEDNKCIRITAFPIGQEPETQSVSSTANETDGQVCKAGFFVRVAERIRKFFL